MNEPTSSTNVWVNVKKPVPGTGMARSGKSGVAMPTMALETRARMRLPVSQPKLNSAMPALRRQMPQGIRTEASMTAR